MLTRTTERASAAACRLASGMSLHPVYVHSSWVVATSDPTSSLRVYIYIYIYIFFVNDAAGVEESVGHVLVMWYSCLWLLISCCFEHV